MRPQCYLLALFGSLVIGFACFPARGQDLSEIQRLAAQTTARVAKEGPKHVFLEIGNDCIFDTQLCETLESNLRVELTKLIPEIQFVSRENFLQVLKKKGFLSTDADSDSLAREFASEMGSEI